MEQLFLINTFLGFAVMQLYDILSRDKASQSSPQKFNVWFFIKDSWFKILLSLLLSFGITFIVHLNLEDVQIFADGNLYGNLIYVIIGAVPEYLMQKIKKKYGFAQPTVVKVKGEEFTRKQ